MCRDQSTRYIIFITIVTIFAIYVRLVVLGNKVRGENFNFLNKRVFIFEPEASVVCLSKELYNIQTVFLLNYNRLEHKRVNLIRMCLLLKHRCENTI